MNVRLHIDRLVLEGLEVPYASRAALRAAVETELTRLIAGGGLSPALAGGIAVPSVRAPQINADGTPQQLGTSIAGAVYGGVGGRKG
jgi:hypothetical protein